MDTEEKLTFFKEMIQCCYPVSFSVYSPDLQLLDSDAPGREIYDTLFALSPSHAYLEEYKKTSDLPVLLSNSLGLMWAAVFEKKDGSTRRIHFMGPAFTSVISTENLETELDRHNLSVAMKISFLKVLHDVPVIPATQLFQYTIMLHDCLNGEKLSIGDLQHQDSAHREPVRKDPEREGHDLHPGIRNAEAELMRMVEEGNTEYKAVMSHASSLSSGVKASVKNPVQLARYNSVTFLTLVSRAAIRGGLPAPTAYTLNDLYTEQIDSCKTLGELAVLNGTMYGDFIYRVHKCRRNPGVSKPVRCCCDTIDMHIRDRIDIDSLAKMTGYSAYYLSRKFREETGQSVHAYITAAKISYSKLLLSSTRDSVQEISDQLNFCSRSYFTDQFLKLTGMTPTRYREEHNTM